VRLSGFRFRAILVPLGVALVSIAAVAWYDLVKIPAQQRYITGRNLRLLKTKSAQIKAKVDNFGISIDNVLHFYAGTDSAKYTEELQRYMRKFSSSVEILSKDESKSARASDKSRAVLRRDAGRNFLYLTYRHDGRVIVAKSDIEEAVAPFLNSGSEFDAMLLATGDGAVIAQHSSRGLDLAHLDGLRESVRPIEVEGDAKDSPPSVFQRLRASTNVENVLIGNAEYQMYVQPVVLSLTSDEDEADGQLEWALCGLVRADHFRAAGSAISYTYLLWFGVALATVCLAIPLLKLHMLSPSERLRSLDGVLVAATTFLATGLVTFCAIDGYYFHVEVNGRTRRDLGTAAHDLGDRFKAETRAIAAEMEDLRDPKVWKALGYAGRVKNGPFALGRLELPPIGPDGHPATIRIEGNEYFCEPRWACRDDVFANPAMPVAKYPYFESVMWLDNAGWQRIKWSAGRVTPPLNVRQHAYFQQLAKSRIGWPGSDSGVAVIQSKNTGEVLTIFWKALARDYAAGQPHLAGQAMVVAPLSLVNPVMPAHVQFAVVDRSGVVMFHSDATRSLRENFFVECEDNAALRSAVQGRRSTYLNASYFARSHAMYVTPLELPSFGDPGWTLVVLRDRSVMETINLETLAASVLLFAIYGGLLAAAWAILFALRPSRFQKWFWPDPSARMAYRAAVAVNAALGALVLGSISRLEPTRLLVATALVVSVALVSTFLLISRKQAPIDSTTRWETSFHLARVSFLFIIAAVPAIVCFVVAYDFEMTLMARHSRADVMAQLAARLGRIKDRAAKLPMCAPDRNEAAAKSCRDFITSRETAGDWNHPWDVAVTTAAAGGTALRTGAPLVTRLDAFLAAVHVPYNDTAVALATVLPSRRDEWNRHAASPEHPWRGWPAPSSVIQAQVTWPVWLTAAGILGLLYLLLRVVVRPLYLLDAYGIRVVRAADVKFDGSGHTLLVGPPGTDKSATLARQKNIRIFDARTCAFVGQGAATHPVPVQQRRSRLAQFWLLRLRFPDREPATFGAPSDAAAGAEWLDVSQLPSDGDAPIGIDHLECSIDDPVNRPKMLRLIERLIYEHRRTVYVAAARDPIAQLREADGGGPDAGEMSRWIRVFRLFREHELGLEQSARGEQDARGDQYARAIWSSCSQREQLALRQLADEDVVNPHSVRVMAQLMRRGLVRRDRRFHLVDGRFQRFVMQAMPADEVSRREGEGVNLPWASKATVAFTVAIGIATALLLTSQQMVDAWIGYMPALAPAVPTMLKWFAAARDPKSAAENV
jgi:hypothetical protein